MRKKGIFHALDGLLSGVLLIATVLLLLQTPFYESSIEQKSFVTQDMLNILSEIKIEELNNTFIEAEISNGNITNTQNTVLEQMGEYWALNQNAKATTLFEIVFNNTFPDKIGLQLDLESEELFLKNVTVSENIVTGRRMISGIAKGAPLSGFSSSAYLKKVRNKKTSSYSYLGGFYGQGNISTTLSLPSDFDPTRLTDAELKIETPGSFELFINGDSCNSFTGQKNVVTKWDISSCNNSFQSGNNTLEYRFSSLINLSYISGGFVKVTYTTDTLKEDQKEGYKRYYLPKVNGFINIFDAISAQGLITNWTVNVTFFNEYDTFFTFGNETVFVATGSNVTQNIVFKKTNQTIAPTQIPIRMGVTNFSNITVLQAGTPADSILVTDVSGSMTNCGQYGDPEPYCSYLYNFWFWWIYTECPLGGSCVADECGTGSSSQINHNIFNQSLCNATLLKVAQESGKLFVDVVLNNSLHQVGLVDFANNANTPTPLTQNSAVLNNVIDNYVANGGTCTCCGINRAKDELDNSTNNKFIILLSDGEPTLYCSNFNDYTGSSGSSALSRQWAIDAGQNACAQNITVYTIGFGEGMSATGHDVMEQIACNTSLYFNATNVSQLADIYRNISDQILIAANYSSQTVSVVGNFSESKIIDGYIDLHFDPITPADTQGRISLTFESEQFNSCSQNIEIPEGVSVEDAFVTSFSSNQWTKLVKANNVTVFNLTEYGSEYTLLGDPFIIQIPSPILTPGENNTIVLEIGDTPGNTTVCSDNNTFIYTALINASTPRTQTVEVNEGCSWTVQSEADTNSTFDVPIAYNGTNTCEYSSQNISYNSVDAYDVATIALLESLDPDNNGKILVDLTASDLEISITIVEGVPYLWGPSIVSLDTWN